MSSSNTPRVIGPATAVIYECLDANFDVIYVGRTSALRPRIARHKVASSWWDEVVEIRHGMPLPAERAKQEELELIVLLQPKHNKAGLDGSDNAALARRASLTAKRLKAS